MEMKVSWSMLHMSSPKVPSKNFMARTSGIFLLCINFELIFYKRWGRVCPECVSWINHQYDSWNIPYNELHTLFRYTHIFLCRTPNPQEELVLTLCQHSPGMPSRTLCSPSGTGVPWSKAIFSQRKLSKSIQIAQTCSREKLALCLEGSWETQLTGWVRVTPFLIWERFAVKWEQTWALWW